MKKYLTTEQVVHPVNIILVLYSFQILVWYLFFDYAIDIFLVEKTTYFTIESIFKHFCFIGIFIFSIIFGINYAKNIGHVSSINLFQTKKINNIHFILFILFSLASFMYFKSGINNYDVLQTSVLESGFSKIAYAAREDKSILSTFVNLFPYLVVVYYFNKTYKFRNFVLLFIGFSLFILGFFYSMRVLFVDYIIMLIVLISIKNNVKYGLTKILLLLLLMIFFMIISEMFRYGVINSVHYNLELFSIKNFSNVVMYLLTAYIGSDVNNSLIYYDSTPSYRLMYSGSPLIYNAINQLGYFNNNFMTIVPIERHGTINFLALLWNEWGYFAISWILIIGFFIGYSYYQGIKLKNHFWLVVYLILLPAIVFSMRQNYFFQMYIYLPLLVLMGINLFYRTNKR